jgi:hypothetical protein
LRRPGADDVAAAPPCGKAFQKCFLPRGKRVKEPGFKRPEDTGRNIVTRPIRAITERAAVFAFVPGLIFRQGKYLAAKEGRFVMLLKAQERQAHLHEGGELKEDDAGSEFVYGKAVG